MKHFRCACGAVEEITSMCHPSQSYCGLCKTAPVEVRTVASLTSPDAPLTEDSLLPVRVLKPKHQKKSEIKEITP
jgi:hypothetical protein